MRTENNFIGNYYKIKTNARINMLIDNYVDFPSYMAGYKSGLQMFISSILACDRRSEKGELGVRVQTSTLQDMTAQMAVENVMIEEAISRGDSDAFSFKDKQDAEDVSLAINELQLMEKEYASLQSQVEALSREDQEIFLSFADGSKTVEELSEELTVTVGTVYTRMYRIKNKMKGTMKMFMFDYSDGMKRIGRVS